MDINDKIAANSGLVYLTLRKFMLLNDPDAESLSYEALHKAICTYDDKAATAFSTYAVCVISNALRHLLRHRARKRQLVVISYDEPAYEADGDALLLDTIAHPDTVETNLRLKALHEAIDRVLNSFTSEAQRRILLIWMNSNYTMSQSEIAAKANISQATVSRTISGFRNKLSKELEEHT